MDVWTVDIFVTNLQLYLLCIHSSGIYYISFCCTCIVVSVYWANSTINAVVQGDDQYWRKTRNHFNTKMIDQNAPTPNYVLVRHLGGGGWPLRTPKDLWFIFFLGESCVNDWRQFFGPSCTDLFCVSCTHFSQLILRKIIQIAATRCHILKPKCAKFDFG